MKAWTSMVIDRPIEDVFAFAAGVENMDRWVEGVSEPRRTSGGGFGVGSTFVSKYTYGGKTHDIGYVVTAHDPPTRYGVRSTSGPFPFEGVIELEAVGGRTRITNTIDAGADGTFTRLTFAVAGPLLRVMMRKQLRKELERLKLDLESASRVA